MAEIVREKKERPATMRAGREKIGQGLFCYRLRYLGWEDGGRRDAATFAAGFHSSASGQLTALEYLSDVEQNYFSCNTLAIAPPIFVRHCLRGPDLSLCFRSLILLERTERAKTPANN